MSVENRREGLPRVADLRAGRPQTRFLSVEPLLEDLGPIDLNGIHWVIAGGESGHGFRPVDPSWVIGVRDQCKAAGVPFFFKQWGGIHKAKAGRVLDGETYDEKPPRQPALVLDDDGQEKHCCRVGRAPARLTEND